MTEPIPIGDWLTSYKLGDYTSLFEANGYDRTDFLLSITSDELTEIGVQKPGHKKKILSAVSALIHTEHLISTKPVSTDVHTSIVISHESVTDGYWPIGCLVGVEGKRQ